jgi:hypothetical protein
VIDRNRGIYQILEDRAETDDIELEKRRPEPLEEQEEEDRGETDDVEGEKR